MKTKLFLTGFALMALTLFSNGQDPVAKQGQGNGQRNGQCCGNGAGKGSVFVDKNNDGVCDNIGKSASNGSGNKANGICNGTGKGLAQGNSKGKNFVDADKNGVCDNNKPVSK